MGFAVVALYIRGVLLASFHGFLMWVHFIKLKLLIKKIFVKFYFSNQYINLNLKFLS